MRLEEKLSLPQIVRDRIRRYIIDNDLKANDKLPSEKQLIDMLKVSRTVVREALKTLETLGILHIKPGDGIYVDSPSLKPFLEQVSFHWKANGQKIRELLATRKILEHGAIEMAIEHYDPGLIGRMDEAIHAMDKAIAHKRPPIEEDLAFHRALFEATGNQTYIELSDVLSRFFSEVRELHFVDIDKTKNSLEEHKQILVYIREKNSAKAKEVMTAHLQPLTRLVEAEPG